MWNIRTRLLDFYVLYGIYTKKCINLFAFIMARCWYGFVTQYTREKEYVFTYESLMTGAMKVA